MGGRPSARLHAETMARLDLFLAEGLYVFYIWEHDFKKWQQAATCRQRHCLWFHIGSHIKLTPQKELLEAQLAERPVQSPKVSSLMHVLDECCLDQPMISQEVTRSAASWLYCKPLRLPLVLLRRSPAMCVGMSWL